MSSAQDMRCPRTAKMFARYISTVQLVEVSCQECRRPLRTSNPDLAHVLHRYSAADGSFVDTLLQWTSGNRTRQVGAA